MDFASDEVELDLLQDELLVVEAVGRGGISAVVASLSSEPRDPRYLALGPSNSAEVLEVVVEEAPYRSEEVAALLGLSPVELLEAEAFL